MAHVNSLTVALAKQREIRGGEARCSWRVDRVYEHVIDEQSLAILRPRRWWDVTLYTDWERRGPGGRGWRQNAYRDRR